VADHVLASLYDPETAEQGVESVSKVDVSLENKSATIELTDAASITADQLASLVKDLGFEVQLKS
jgi:copper chaperone CopZ